MHVHASFIDEFRLRCICLGYAYHHGIFLDHQRCKPALAAYYVRIPILIHCIGLGTIGILHLLTITYYA